VAGAGRAASTIRSDGCASLIRPTNGPTKQPVVAESLDLTHLRADPA